MLLCRLLCFVGTRSTLSIIIGAVWIDNPNVLLMSTLIMSNTKPLIIPNYT